MTSQGRKPFFFAKKKQKTFDCFGFGPSEISSAPTRKSFLVLFFKKEPLPYGDHPSWINAASPPS
jgi:hypothetical protein